MSGILSLGLVGLLLALPQTDWAVEVTEAQQTPFSSNLIGFKGDEVEFFDGSQRLRRPTNSLLSVRFVEHGQQPAGGNSYSLQLVDGTTIRVSSVRSDGTKFSVQCGTQQLQLSARNALTLQLRKLNEDQQAAFDAIGGSAVNSDTLMVLAAGGAISKIEGIVNSISNDSVSFEFGGTNIDVSFSKLAGIRFFSAGETTRPKLKAIVHDTYSNEWLATSLVNASVSEVAVQLQCGDKVVLPIDSLASIDFSFGSMLYLAELEPVRRSADSGFEFAIKLPIDELLGVRPEPAVSIPGRAIGPSLRFVGSSQATYRIPDAFSRFLGSVELSPPGEKYTPCRVQVFLENKLAWEQVLGQSRSPVDFDLEVQGDQQLRLVVQANSQLPTGAVVLWREARLLK